MIGWIGHVKYIGERGSSPAVLPINTAPPVITGALLIGSTLTATPGVWSGADSVTGEWYVDGIATSETGLTYEVQLADAGLLIEYRETASNSFGSATAGASVVAASLIENVEALYAGGENGAIYYFTEDFAGLYQDAAGSTPVTAVGQPVGLMLDKSGNGNHASQPTTTARPLLQRDANGKLYLAFDGVDDVLLGTGLTIPYAQADGFTLMCGVSVTETAEAYSPRILAVQNGTSQYIEARVRGDSAARLIGIMRKDSVLTPLAPQVQTGNYAYTPSQPFAYSLWCAADALTVKANTTTNTVNYAGDPSTTFDTIGLGGPSVAGGIIAMQVRGALVINRVLTDDERGLVRDWLMEGIA